MLFFIQDKIVYRILSQNRDICFNEGRNILDEFKWDKISVKRFIGERMLEAIGYEDSRKSESLLGLLGYYEAILDRKGLVARIGEIRSLKLGLTLDLLKVVNIAEDLKANLISSVLSSWEMNRNDKMLVHGEEEIKTMRSSIAAVREKAQMVSHNCSPSNSMQLDVTVMLALPLMPHDLKRDDVPKICDLLNQVMEDFSARKEPGFSPCL